MRAHAAVAAVVLFAWATGTADPAAAAEDPLQISGLQVLDGEETWHPAASSAWQPEPDFRVRWEQPTMPFAAVEYRLWNGQGEPVGPVVQDRADFVGIEVSVPEPGAFTLELRVLDAEGRAGPPATVPLRYDDTVPPAPLLHAPAGWLGKGEAAVLSIEPPANGLPLSGLRGYAIATDDSDFPCASSAHCSLAETDVFAGATAADRSLGTLPQGTTTARAVSVSGAGVPSAVSMVDFHVDLTSPTVQLAGVPAGWATGPVRLRVTAGDALSGMGAAGPGGPFTALTLDGSAPISAPGATVEAVLAGSGIHTVAYYARDAAGNVADGVAGAPAPATATVRIDEEPPAVRFAERQDPSEPERIEATVEDELSGPSAAEGSIGLRLAGGQVPFKELPTRVVGDKLVATWDSDSYPTGKYEFRAIGFDKAGNSARGTRRLHGAQMVLVNPLKTQVRVESGLAANRGASRTLAYGHSVRFAGRLRSTSGSPLAGLEVVVTERFAAGANPATRTSYARTEGDGGFSVWLGPGPSRTVVATFAGNRVLTRAAGKPVGVDVRGSVSLRSSSASARVGGRPIVFAGSIGTRGAAATGKGRRVELQFRYPGAPWRTFRTVETDRSGRFRLRYAFSDDDSRGVRFQFRASVPAEGGWPYESASSRPVSVRGV